jgi:uncharacterized MnhB-related membrane protein
MVHLEGAPVIELVLQLFALGAIVVLAPFVVLTRDPRPQSLTLTLYGLSLGLAFVAFAAPDVALAQLTVGAVALPLMVLLTLARMRRHAERDRAARSRQERAS